MPFDTIAARAPTLFVSTTAELEAAYIALSNTNGGGTIQLTSDFSSKGIISLSDGRNSGGDEPVHITSANIDDPASVARIIFNGVENVKVSNLHVDSTGMSVPDWQGDVDVSNSSQIVFDNLTMSSDGSQYFANNSGVDGGRALVVRDSSDVMVAGGTVTDYFQAYSFVRSSDLVIEDNDISGIQGDGIKMSQVADVLVKDNYLHDFARTPNEFFHSDFIQLHSGGNVSTTSSDITITGNVLDTGNGVSAQGIWLGNEAYVSTGQNRWLYNDITVTDNLIYTGSANGIGLGGTNGALISNNTLLWNSEAVTPKFSGDTSFEPRIRVEEGARNVQVADNITPILLIEANRGVQTSGNEIVEYNPNDPDYADNHFHNVADGGDIDWRDWQLLGRSDWVGKGAPVSQPDGNSNNVADVPDSPDPVDRAAEEESNTVEQDEAPSAGNTFGTGGVSIIDGDTLLSLDFASALVVDNSDYGSAVRNAATRNLVDEGQNTAYEIGRNQMIRFDVDNQQLHELESFGFEMDLRLLNPTDTGRFLHFPRAFEALIENDGTITFSLMTDEGTFRVNSGEPVLDDMQSHNFAVGYDDATGQLSMVIDGTVVDKTDAGGTTSEGAHHGLTIGTIWGDPVNAVVDNIHLGTDPMDAGVDLSRDVGEMIQDTSSDFNDNGIGSGNGVDPVLSAINPKDAFFAMEFEQDTLTDLSAYSSTVKRGDVDNIVANDTGHGFLISDDSRIILERANDQIHELDSFGFRIDLQLLDDQDTGRFLHFPRAFEARIEDDRSVSFELSTDKGTFRVNSGETTLDDLDVHSLSVGYDADNSRMTLNIDGDVVDSVAAFGTTSEAVHHGLTIGSVWGDGVTAIVDNVWFGDSPEAVGADTTAGVIFALQATATDTALASAAAEDDNFADDDLDLAS